MSQLQDGSHEVSVLQIIYNNYMCYINVAFAHSLAYLLSQKSWGSSISNRIMLELGLIVLKSKYALNDRLLIFNMMSNHVIVATTS